MFTRAGQSTSLCCDAVHGGEGSEREQCHLLHSLTVFSSFPATHKQIGPFWCWFLGRWVCVHSRPLWVSLATLLWGWEFLLLPPQPPQVFSVRGLRLYFPALEPWFAWSVLLPGCSSLFFCTQMWDRQSACHRLAHPGPPAAALPQVLSAQLSISTPPTGLDKCFFFNSLVVGLPCRLIFWQFWLFFLF